MSNTNKLTAKQVAALQTLVAAGGTIVLNWTGKNPLNCTTVNSLARKGLVSRPSMFQNKQLPVTITDAGRAVLA